MRFTSKVAGFAVALVVSSTAANAQVTVSGTTTGCFGAGCSPTTSTAMYMIDATGTSVMFTGTTFSGTTNPVTNAFTVGNFGSFVLNGLSGSTPNNTFSTPFTLRFNMTAPPGSNSPSQALTISGFVGNVGGVGARDISYTGGTTAFTFTNGSGTIMVDPGFIGPMSTNISGRVVATASTVPEPSTYALMGTGLAGLLAAARRRRSV